MQCSKNWVIVCVLNQTSKSWTTWLPVAQFRARTTEVGQKSMGQTLERTSRGKPLRQCVLNIGLHKEGLSDSYCMAFTFVHKSTQEEWKVGTPKSLKHKLLSLLTPTLY